MALYITCPDCGTNTESKADPAKFATWSALPHATRPFVQVEFPELDADQRELLLTGICPKCWNEMFTLTKGDQ